MDLGCYSPQEASLGPASGARPPATALTSQRGEEAFHGAAHGAEDEVAVPGGVEGDSEAEAGHEQICHRQVHQDVVERLPQLLVLEGDQQGEEVDGQPRGDEEEDVAADQAILPGLGQVVLGVLEGAPHHPGLVGHRHIEVDPFRPVHPAPAAALPARGAEEQRPGLGTSSLETQRRRKLPTPRGRERPTEAEGTGAAAQPCPPRGPAVPAAQGTLYTRRGEAGLGAWLTLYDKGNGIERG